MPALASDLRRDLEKVVKEARAVAERGAKAALESLTVHEAKSGGHLDEAGRKLRSRLRALAKQLGDKREASGAQQIARLVRACAYEHWHRMLFARFLAENDLLIHPEHKVAVTLEEVEELAREEGVDQWELASRYSERMLPQIFRRDDPLLGVALPRERRLELEALLESLPVETLQADDALGWTYQFWQSAEKDAVNNRVKSGEKITGETLPAVTQLFTEHYMVQFLLHNTIGAWHAGKTLTSRDREEAASEQHLRDAVKLAPLGGYDFEYLRFVREAKEGEDLNAGTGPWRPAAGTYDGWPREAKSLRVLDPCCGSGHFLVAAFDLLVRLRIAEENLSTEDAIRAVLADNLFGLELDPRCTQIAAFNLAFAAWKLAGKPIDLPALNIACSGIGPQSTKDEWLKMAERELEKEPAIAREPIRRGLIHMHELFSDAPELGSLIDPSELPAEGFAADFETIKPLLDRILAAETADDEAHERAVAARGMAAAAEILACSNNGYSLVATNFPFLTQNKLPESVRAHVQERLDYARPELAIALAASWIRRSEVIAFVSPSEWTYLGRFEPFRQHVMLQRHLRLHARLGFGSFDTPLRVNPELCIVGSSAKRDLIARVDTSTEQSVTAKARTLCSTPISIVCHRSIMASPDARLVSTQDRAADASLLEEFAEARAGLYAGDGEQFNRCYWEIETDTTTWEFLQSTVSESVPFGGRNTVVRWENETGSMASLAASVRHLNHAAQNWRRGKPLWGHMGVAVSLMGDLHCTVYCGDRYDMNCCAVVPKDQEHLPALWEFCSSGEFGQMVRAIDQSLKLTPKTLLKIPFDVDRWIASSSSLPEPQSDDPTQWLFHGHPERAAAPTALQVGVARLVGYRWPAELDEDMRLAPKARELVDRCAELAEHADDDGIVCLSSVRGEPSASDRLERLLRASFGEAWSAGKAHDLLAAAGAHFNKGKAEPSIKDWLRDRFFEEHCALFHSRPFVWHIWDGKKDGFHALVNYHKLAAPGGVGRQTLETLTYAYLGDWITKQKQQVDAGTPGAEARLAAATELKVELEKILAGEPPYDLFIRWKPLHEQPIGWEPDINDGVRLNIRPFMMAADVGKKGAGMLRAMPKSIKWDSDRGKEPQSLRPKADFPWFWSWDERTQNFIGGAEFDGVRWNDLHYTNAAKQRARERAAKEIEV
jgi:hypothetical protein